MNSLMFSIVLFANAWIWKIFHLNFFIFILLIFTSIFIYSLLAKKSNKISIKLLVVFILLIFLQYKNTEIVNLTNFTNDDIRVRDMRLAIYPFTRKTIAYWLEASPQMTAFYRISRNFSEISDINLYFFANHPRERVGYPEFGKFPFIFLPLFVLGLMLFVQEGINKNLLFSFLIPIIFYSIFGSNSSLGPFMIFPGMVVCMAKGCNFLILKLKNEKSV